MQIRMHAGGRQTLTKREFIKTSTSALFALRPEYIANAGEIDSLIREVPLIIEGDWGQMYKSAVKKVVERARAACLNGVKQRSDRQPRSLKIERHASGPPSIWLHDQPRDQAWIIVNIGERDWSKLAYQFGHELGHVMANSWQQNSRVDSSSTCQWIEEAAAEAFSLNGLRQLSESWSIEPPFPNDSAFGHALALYSRDIIKRYEDISVSQGNILNSPAWFANHQSELETKIGLNDGARAFSLVLMKLYVDYPATIEALGALNRWPERAKLPVASYLDKWAQSCVEIGVNSFLPKKIKSYLKINF